MRSRQLTEALQKTLIAAYAKIGGIDKKENTRYPWSEDCQIFHLTLLDSPVFRLVTMATKRICTSYPVARPKPGKEYRGPDEKRA